MPQNESECFNEFQSAIKEKDFGRVKDLTNSFVDDPVTVLSKYEKPAIHFLPEKSNGAFGVKVQPNVTLIYATIEDGYTVKDTFVVGIMKEAKGYYVSHFSKVATVEQKNKYVPYVTPYDKNGQVIDTTSIQ